MWSGVMTDCILSTLPERDGKVVEEPEVLGRYIKAPCQGGVWLEMDQNIMMTFVNAKINIGLQIVRRREDGYHDLQTVFYPVGNYAGTPSNPSHSATCSK